MDIVEKIMLWIIVYKTIGADLSNKMKIVDFFDQTPPPPHTRRNNSISAALMPDGRCWPRPL